MKAALIAIDGGSIVAIGVLPFTHVLADGGLALLSEAGEEVPAHAPAYRVMEYVEVEFARPGLHYTQGDDVETRDGDVITVTRQWTAWTQPEIDAHQSAMRDALIEQRLNDTEDILRAFAKVYLEDRNAFANRNQAILQAAADATSLATFKTAMASIPPIAQRTLQQLRAALRAELGANGN